jgi:hypothetical protein
MRTIILLVTFLFINKAFSCAIPQINISVVEHYTGKPLRGVILYFENKEKTFDRYTTDSSGHVYAILGFHTYTITIIFSKLHKFHTKVKIYPDYSTNDIIIRLSILTEQNTIQLTRHIYKGSLGKRMKEKIKVWDLTTAPETEQFYREINSKVVSYGYTETQFKISANYSNDEIKTYPNPVNGGILNVESNFDTNKMLAIYNLAGNELLRAEIVLHQTIDTSQLPPGIYFLKVTDDKNDDVTVKKIVIP